MQAGGRSECGRMTGASVWPEILAAFSYPGSSISKEDSAMVYVIAEPCIGTKDTACVDVCPVDCIHPKKDEPNFETFEQLYIEPDECIDCGACVPACPVSAIFALEDLPEKWSRFTAVNADWYKANK